MLITIGDSTYSLRAIAIRLDSGYLLHQFPCGMSLDGCRQLVRQIERLNPNLGTLEIQLDLIKILPVN